MGALQNDRLRSMPASFLPPSPVNKPGKPVLHRHMGSPESDAMTKLGKTSDMTSLMYVLRAGYVQDSLDTNRRRFISNVRSLS